MSEGPVSRVFGKRKKQHTIILASGDNIRHWTIRPWVFGLAASFLVVMAIGYLMATTYLVLRDDLIGAAMARQARIQHAYEDRIATLRSQVDSITSRQLLDQQMMEGRMAELMQQQARLTTRHGRLGLLLEKADVVDFRPTHIPIPTAKPLDRHAPAEERRAAIRPVITQADETVAAASLDLRSGGLAYAPTTAPKRDKTNRIFEDLLTSLHTMEQEQAEHIYSLTSNAFQTADTINSILRKTGIPTDADTGIGGPFVSSDSPGGFESSLDELGTALDRLEKARSKALKMPVGHPAPNHAISSNFGKRRDPFLKRVAHHAGIDFKTRYGQPILATGAGVVKRAGRKGGYGKMVEIDHGDGFTTRYAHLSRTHVKVGQSVKTGTKIGAAGSTGRSTGPHLHYEVRYHDKAINPKRFLNAGKKLEPLL
ncbi:MAG: M23 family metallopeptidase [Alphaproteobacteria bacterium]|nr:M23 family metallopeptidase [Alphaproteobacteria bacterium]